MPRRRNDANTGLWLVALALAGAWLYVERQKAQAALAKQAQDFVRMNPGMIY